MADPCVAEHGGHYASHAGPKEAQIDLQDKERGEFTMRRLAFEEDELY